MNDMQQSAHNPARPWSQIGRETVAERTSATVARLRLERLAPEMAEAILYLVECYQPETEDDRDDTIGWERMHAVTEKLRQIGAVR